MAQLVLEGDGRTVKLDLPVDDRTNPLLHQLWAIWEEDLKERMRASGGIPPVDMA